MILQADTGCTPRLTRQSAAITSFSLAWSISATTLVAYRWIAKREGLPNSRMVPSQILKPGLPRKLCPATQTPFMPTPSSLRSPPALGPNRERLSEHSPRKGARRSHATAKAQFPACRCRRLGLPQRIGRELRLQVRGKTPPLARRPDNQQPMIARIVLACEKTARFEPVHEACDLAFVSAHDLGELSGRDLAFFRTVHEHRRFLGRHPKLAETAIESGLQPYAGTKEPRYGEFCLPLSHAGILRLRLLRWGKGIPEESPILPAQRCSCHRFGRQNFLR